MKTYHVRTSSKKYTVHSGSFGIKEIVHLVTQNLKCDRFFVLIDKNVNKIYGTEIQKEFNRQTGESYFFQMTSLEKQKSYSTIQKIYDELAKQNFGRDAGMILIGGGVVGDIGGFVASTYMRGIKCVHIPTTILAAVDSSIGGKTGYNFRNTKNLIGSFYQPDLVITSTEFFSSLSPKEIDSGIGEIIKYGYLSGKKFYEYLLSNYNSIHSLDKRVIEYVLQECISFKTSVVSDDEREGGIRKVLNFGHTFAHAFESYYQYKISHGKAVAAGILAANILSHKKGIITTNQLNSFQKLPAMMKFPKFLQEFDSTDLTRRMDLDKKNKSGKLNFVLLKDLGELLIDVNVNKNELNSALNEFKRLISV
jgi:3-dehydroquinate synthase